MEEFPFSPLWRTINRVYWILPPAPCWRGLPPSDLTTLTGLYDAEAMAGIMVGSEDDQTSWKEFVASEMV